MRYVLLAMLALVSQCGNAYAWGDEGHKIVCEIAFRLAQPDTRSAVRKLIRSDTEFDTFSESCVFPDHPRKRASEHFLNLARNSQGLTSDDCPQAEKCVLSAILNDSKILASKSEKKADRLLALKFLGHWVGDIHQPLHVSFEDDRGGNNITVRGLCSGKVATEKSKGRTTATVPAHRDFAVSLAAARKAGILGTGEVFTGKLVKGEIVPMNKKAWAAKFKKFARLAGVNEPKKNCHGVRKARAEVAAYSECTEAQMMAMFGWRDHKMPALYIAKASRDKLAISGMEKIEAYDQMENIADLAMPVDENRIVTFERNRRKKS